MLAIKSGKGRNYLAPRVAPFGPSAPLRAGNLRAGSAQGRQSQDRPPLTAGMRPIAHAPRRAAQGDNGKTRGFFIICHPNQFFSFLALFAKQKAQKA